MPLPPESQAPVPLPDPAAPLHDAAAGGCWCWRHARRRLGGGLIGGGLLAALGSPAQAQSDPDLAADCKRSSISKLVAADQLEREAANAYQQMLQQASAKRQLASPEEPQRQRLIFIAKRIVPFAPGCNDRAKQWQWSVNLIGDAQLNAFCMPGGKIAFYLGILAKLQLTDDEVAMIMGHEVAHALLEHARERIGKTTATRGAIELGAALFGLGNTGRALAGIGGQLLTLRFSRDDESEADALGLILAAKAGYDPRAGVTLWRKMLAANKNAPPQWLSTHPSGDSRIQEIEARLPRVMPLYERSPKPASRFQPPVLKSP